MCGACAGGDMHWMLARRYRIPMVSVRDALYSIMFNDSALQAALGVTRWAVFCRLISLQRLLQREATHTRMRCTTSCSTTVHYMQHWE
jgi:hypothetical protein